MFSWRSVNEDGYHDLSFDLFLMTSPQLPLGWFHRKQVLNALYQVCVFSVDPSTKMAIVTGRYNYDFSATTSWIKKKTLQEASTPCPLPSLCFSSRSFNKYDKFSTSALQHLHEFQLRIEVHLFHFHLEIKCSWPNVNLVKSLDNCLLNLCLVYKDSDNTSLFQDQQGKCCKPDL